MLNENRRLYLKKYYLVNKEKIKERLSLLTDELKEVRLNTVRKLKKKYGHTHKAELIIRLGGQCKKCGLKYNGENGACFDFHHINPAEKDFSITTYLRHYSSIPELLYKEVDKCVLVCSNCHRLLHSDKY